MNNIIKQPKGHIKTSIDDPALYLSNETESCPIKFGNITIDIIKNKKIENINTFSSIRKNGITTRERFSPLEITEDDRYYKCDIKEVRGMHYSEFDQEIYKMAKNFALVSGYDFTQKFYLRLNRKKEWTRVYANNIKTLLLYHHFKHNSYQDTISLPLFNTTFSKKLYIDIDDNQIKGVSVNNVVKQLQKDIGIPFYKELKYTSGQKGAHLFFEFKTELFKNAHEYLQKYYFEKYGYKIESNLNIMRLPWSKAYYKGATDLNGNKIESANQLVEVFRKGQSLDIPKFLVPYNKHGIALLKSREFTSKEISINEIIISRGNRVTPMINLAFYAISNNYSLEEYSKLCYDRNDTNNPSKDLASKNADIIIASIYDWAEKHFNKDYSYSKLSFENKSEIFLNVLEYQFDDENYKYFKEIIKYKNPFKDTKYAKVLKNQEFNTYLMTEAIFSMFNYEKKYPSSNYGIKELEPFNEGIPIALSTIELIAKTFKIPNWKKIWKIVKSLFLETIKLDNGYEYSYCNLRYSKHYKKLSLKKLHSTIFKLYRKINKKINKIIILNNKNINNTNKINKINNINKKKLYIKYSYNICCYYFNKNNYLNNIYTSNLMRAGP